MSVDLARFYLGEEAHVVVTGTAPDGTPLRIEWDLRHGVIDADQDAQTLALSGVASRLVVNDRPVTD